MRYYYLFILYLLFNSCTDTPDALFQISTEASFDIAPGLNNIETFIFPISQVPTNFAALSGGVDPNTIGSIQPSRATISAPFVAFDWSIVREVSVRAISPRNPELNREIFFQDQISLNNQNELRLFSSLSDVREILIGETFNLEVRFNFRNITPAEIPSRIEMNFLANGTE